MENPELRTSSHKLCCNSLFCQEKVKPLGMKLRPITYSFCASVVSPGVP